MAFIPLNALHQFLAVARRRSYSAAASELGLSPSALSQAVRQLERRLGVALLTRTTRAVALTDAGRRLLEQAGPAVDRSVEALKAASLRTGAVTGRLRLTVPSIAVPLVIEPILPTFAERYPGVEVEVQVESRLVDIVAEGFDAGVRLEESLERDMVHLRLTNAFRFVVVGAPSYLARRGVPEHPKDLLEHECIVFRSATTGAPVPWDLERGKKGWRVPAHGAFHCNDDRVMLALAEAGLGLTYVFEPVVHDHLKRGSLRLVLEPFAASVPGLFLYFPSRDRASPALRAFIDIARGLLRSKR